MTAGKVPGACQTAAGWMQRSLNNGLQAIFSYMLLPFDRFYSFMMATYHTEEGIIVFFLLPHTTHLLQPLDYGTFASLKGQRRHECQHKMPKIQAKS